MWSYLEQGVADSADRSLEFIRNLRYILGEKLEPIYYISSIDAIITLSFQFDFEN